MHDEQRVLLYGGSFDPVHCGHLEMAEHCRKSLRCRRVILIPLRLNPLKKEGPQANGADRVAMLRRAAGDRQEYEVSELELQREGPSYTYDTVQKFRERFGEMAELFWLVGADAASDLWRWYRIEDLLDTCHICIMRRGGYPVPGLDRLAQKAGARRAARVEQDMIETPEIEISSSEIRRQIRAGQNAADLVPDGVWTYIQKKGLYQQQ